MIGYVRDLLVRLILDPQTKSPTLEELRVVYDVDNAPLDVAPQSVAYLPVRTVPIAYDVGGGMEVRHELEVVLDVQHGDHRKAEEILGLIVTDLTRRVMTRAGDFYAAAPDEETGQTVSKVTCEVDWRPVVVYSNTPNASARIIFRAECDVPPVA